MLTLDSELHHFLLVNMRGQESYASDNDKPEKELVALEECTWEFALSAEGREQFWKSGVLVLPRLLSDADLDLIAAGMHDTIDAFDLDATDKYTSPGTRTVGTLLTRILELEAANPGAAALFHNAAHLSKAFVQKAQGNEKLLSIVSNLLETPNVDSHPVWNYRAQVPGSARSNWHQDACFWPPDAASQPIVSAWMPLVEVNHQNGGLQYIPFGHIMPSTDESVLWRHTYKDNAMTLDPIAIRDILMKREPKALVIQRGQVALFHQLSVHGPMPFHATTRPRISIDFRFLPGGANHGLPAVEAPGRPLKRGDNFVANNFEEWYAESYSTDRKRRGLCGTCGSYFPIREYPEALLGPMPKPPERWNQTVHEREIPLKQLITLKTFKNRSRLQL